MRTNAPAVIREVACQACGSPSFLPASFLQRWYSFPAMEDVIVISSDLDSEPETTESPLLLPPQSGRHLLSIVTVNGKDSLIM